MAALQHARFCKGCWEQMHLPVPLRGVLSVPFRAFGIRPSRMNPNTCTICELMFTKVMRARKITIDATVMFADLRGYTSLSQSLSADAVSGLLDVFYDECADAIWEHDGLLNKTIGDAVMAVFNFPMRGEIMPKRACSRRARSSAARRAARELAPPTLGLTRANSASASASTPASQLWRVRPLASRPDRHRHRRQHRARAQSVAEAGQILVTQAVYQRARSDLQDSHQELPAQGLRCPDQLYAA